MCECRKPKDHNACKKGYICNSGTCTCENVEYLATTIEDSVNTCDEIINDTNRVSTIVPKNVTSTFSTNFYNKKVRYKMSCYLIHTVLLVIILLFIIAIKGYHYA